MPTNSRRRGGVRRDARAARHAGIEAQYGVKIENSRPMNIGHRETQELLLAYDRATKFNTYGK